MTTAFANPADPEEETGSLAKVSEHACAADRMAGDALLEPASVEACASARDDTLAHGGG